MRLTYHYGWTRWCTVWGWLSLMAWVSWWWLGMMGPGLVCVTATRWLRTLKSGQQQVFELEGTALRRVWVLPWAVCIDAGGGSVWLCRDEVLPAAWAELLRGLYRHVPAQAEGLNISN